MSANALRTSALVLIGTALSLALISCGKAVSCNSGNGGTCQCGSGAAAACPVNLGPELLYAYSNSGQVLAFSIAQSGGALTAVNSVPGPARALGLTTVSNQFLYASDPLTAQLYGYSIDQGSGALTALSASPFATGALSFPAQLASPQATTLLYAADVGRVDAFMIGTNGMPTPLSGSPFATGANLFLTVDPSGNFLYTPVLDPPGGVAAFNIGLSGTLTQVSGSPFAVPGQALPSNPPTAIVDTGSFVYETLPATGQIAGFSINTGTGVLTPAPGSPFAVTGIPIALVSARGFVYTIDGLNIAGYSINPDNGALTALSGSTSAIGAVAMATDSLSQHLYVAGALGIQAFSINSNTGALAPLAGSPFPAANEVTLLSTVQIP